MHARLIKEYDCLSSWHLDLDEATGIWVATCNLNLLQSICLRSRSKTAKLESIYVLDVTKIAWPRVYYRCISYIV